MNTGASKKISAFLRAWLALFAIAFGSIASAQGISLFLPAGSAEISSKAQAQEKKIRTSPSTRRLALVGINYLAFEANAITLALPDGTVLQAIKKQAERHGPDSITWFGRTPHGEATFTRVGSNVSGIIQDGSRTFELKSLDGHVHALIEINRTGLPPEHPASEASGEKTSDSAKKADRAPIIIAETSNSARVQASAVPQVDVLILYTPQAAAALGDINSAFQLAISRMNSSFTNSQVNMTVALAGTMAVASDYPSSTAALDALTSMSAAKSKRDNVNADVVVMIGHFADSCGLAQSIGATPANSFAVVADSCLNANLSMAHEIGHLVGARHNVEVDPTNTPFAYGHGKTYDPFPGQPSICWHTIMAYPVTAYAPQESCTDPRINYWANPNVTYPTAPGGITGTASCCNTALVLNQRAAAVAAFSNTKLSFVAILSVIVSNMFVFDQ